MCTSTLNKHPINKNLKVHIYMTDNQQKLILR